MRITVDIDEAQLREVQDATGQRKKSPAIRQALAEFVTETRRKRLLRKVMDGHTDYSLSNDELEALSRYDTD